MRQKMLYLYTCLHGNLQYSCIPREHYARVVDNCFWPVVNLAEELEIPMGFEFPSYTLYEIERSDKTLLGKLRQLQEQGGCEIIGSCWVQNILPLCPAELNARNLAFGREDYRYFFGKQPEVAFINEGCYSSGLPQLYREAGYKAVIYPWDMVGSMQPAEKKWGWRPQLLVGAEGTKMPVIWNNLTANFVFRRYLWGEITLDDYFAFLTRQRGDEERVLPLWCSDWEWINYRPLRHDGNGEDLHRFRRLLEAIKATDWLELVTPSDILQRFTPEEEVRPELAENPIPTYRYSNYNVVRWAVSGRDDPQLNTLSWRFYTKLQEFSALCRSLGREKEQQEELDALWREACLLWSSDLRTWLTDGKYQEFRNRFGVALARVERDIEALTGGSRKENGFSFLRLSEEEVQEKHLTFPPGRYPETLRVEENGREIPSQLEEDERYQDGSLRAAKLVFFSPGSKGEKSEVSFYPAAWEAKQTEGEVAYEESGVISTPAVRLELDLTRGARIKSLTVPRIWPEPLLGMVQPAPLADFYSADFQLKGEGREWASDNSPAQLEYRPESFARFPLRVPFTYKIETALGILRKTYYVYRELPRVEVEYHFILGDVRPEYFRIVTAAVASESFRRETLRYRTVNGGKGVEEFFLAGKEVAHHQFVGVNQDELMGGICSARTCLGATEGWVEITDGEKGIRIRTDPAQLYSVPMIHYEELGEDFLLRVIHSLAESDETGRTCWRGLGKLKFCYEFIDKMGLR